MVMVYLEFASSTLRLTLQGNGPRYTYTPAGRLKTRTWARGIATTYKYGFDDAVPNTQHGQLTVIDYGDSTPEMRALEARQEQRSQRVAVVGLCLFAGGVLWGTSRWFARRFSSRCVA